VTTEIKTPRQDVAEFAGFGIRAFTTTRDAGTFSLSGPDPAGEVLSRWTILQEDLSPFARRTVIARQVHGTTVITHRGGWEGLLRTWEADGHVAAERGITLAVSVADCVPIFMAHPSGIVGLLHSGWRGTVARIVDSGINAYGRLGLPPDELKLHLGPSICGRCYEVSADVREQLTGQPATRSGNVDLRSLIAEHARELGVSDISVSAECTKCDNDRFFSHRAGDTGRQIAVIVGDIF
jgi:YfiH family protein